MITRAEFEQRREDARSVAKHEGRVLAAVAVPLGVAQLAFLRWSEGQVARGPQLIIAVSAFTAYLALVTILSYRMDRRLRAAQPRCPQCGVILKGVAERVTALTGRCEACHGTVFDDAERAEGGPEVEQRTDA